MGKSASDDVDAWMTRLTDEQQDELEEAFREQDDNEYWSTGRRHRWLRKEAKRRGWIG